MVECRQISALLAAAALVIGACGGGDDSDSRSTREESDVAPIDAGDAAATAELSLIELVWAIDGEPVDPVFDYSEPIERDRYEAGLRLDAVFTTIGNVGDITTDLFLPVTINDDKIEAASIIGPERAITRPDRDEFSIVPTDAGFTAQFLIGRPLSPISLVNSRRRAVEAGLDPDDEVVDLGAGQTFNAAGINDIPAAPQDGSNEFIIALNGSVKFGNGFVLEVGDGVARNEYLERLTIIETTSVSMSTVAGCAAQTERYLELFDEQLAEPDRVLLDRLRAFETISSIVRENDCGPRDFAIPVCKAAEAATAPESILARHLDRCPDEQEIVESTVFEPRFENGIVQLVVPSTRDGLPAYSVALSFPSSWTVETTSEGSFRQKIAISADPDTVGRFTRLDIDTSVMPASLLDDRAAAAVEPDAADADVLRADETTVAGLPARRLIAQLAPDGGEYQIGTAVEIDTERLLTITGNVTDRPELPVDGGGLAALMDCIEASMVVVEYEPNVDPAPVEDCSAITSLSVSNEPAPEADEPEEVPVEEPAPVVRAEPDAAFDGTTITLVSPATDGGPSHVTTLVAPAWSASDINDSVAMQLVKVDSDPLTYLSAAVSFVSDSREAIDRRAEPLSANWSIVSDTETQTLGNRTLRLVIAERTNSDGSIRQHGKIITEVNAKRVLVVQLFASDATDFDSIFNTALTSLTITP